MKQKIRQDLKRVIAIAAFFCMLLWIVGELGVLVRPFEEDFIFLYNVILCVVMHFLICTPGVHLFKKGVYHDLILF